MPFKLPKIRLKYILSSPPSRYWGGFLLSFVAILLLILAFDAWIFWKYSLSGVSNEVLVTDASVENVSRSALARVFEKIQSKNEAFEKFRALISEVEDPS